MTNFFALLLCTAHTPTRKALNAQIAKKSPVQNAKTLKVINGFGGVLGSPQHDVEVPR